jgi:Cu-Zn family superoxide dismutase
MEKRGAWILIVAVMLLLAGCGGDGEEAAPEQPEAVETEGFTIEGNFAEAMIEGRSGSELNGMAIFVEEDGKVTVTVDIEKAEPGTHAAHLHEFGDCSAEDGSSAGGHWNPEADDHGKFGEEHFHLGDLGNIEVDENGYGSLTMTTDLWSLGTGDDNDVVGLSIIVHASADDFTTQPTGGAGARIGCGVVVKK